MRKILSLDRGLTTLWYFEYTMFWKRTFKCNSTSCNVMYWSLKKRIKTLHLTNRT